MGIETNKIEEDLTFAEVPAGHFAVTVIPKATDTKEAWAEFFYNAIPSNGFVADENHGIYFECFNQNGDGELWTPVKPKEN